MSANKLTFNNSSNPVPSNTGLVALREFNGGPVAQRDFELNLSNIAHTVNDAIDDNSITAQDLSNLRVSIASNESTQDSAISAALNNLRLEIAEQNTNDLQEAKNYAQTGDTALAALTDASITLTNQSLISVSNSLTALQSKVGVVVREDVVGGELGVLENVINTPNLFESTMTLDSDKKGVTQKAIKTYVAEVKAALEATIESSDNTVNGSFNSFKTEVRTSIANVGARVNQLLTGNALRVKSTSDSTALIDGDSALLANSNSKLATQQAIKNYVDTKIGNTEETLTASITGIVNSAPEALDTLKELADALNDDANFATTITNKITNVQVSLMGSFSALSETLDAEIETIDTSLGNLTSKDTDLENLINTTKVSLGNRIFLTDQSANQRAMTLTNSVNALQVSLNTLDSDLSALIAGVETSVVSLGQTTESVLSTHGTRITANETAVSSLQGATTGINRLSTINAASLVSVNETVVSLGGKISSNTQAIESLSNAPTLSGIPAGALMPYAGLAVPSGWLDCDGRWVTRVAYPELYAAIGDTYGSVEVQRVIDPEFEGFWLPDLRGRTVAGLDSVGVNTLSALNKLSNRLLDAVGTTQVGATGGEAFHKLKVSEMPSHAHDYGSVPGHATGSSQPFGSAGASGNTWTRATTQTGGEASTVATAEDVTAGLADRVGGQTSANHLNTQPTMMLRYIINTGSV